MTAKATLAEALDAFNTSRGSLEESMFISNIAVRYPNGEIEGFSGTSHSSAAKAESIANRKAKKKTKMLGIPESIVLGPKEFAQISHKEKRKLERDWKQSSRFDEDRECSFFKPSARLIEAVEQKLGKDCPEARLSRAALALVREGKEVTIRGLSESVEDVPLQDISEREASVVAMATACDLAPIAPSGPHIWDNGKTGDVRYTIGIQNNVTGEWDMFKASELQGPQGVFSHQGTFPMIPADGVDGVNTKIETLPQAVQTEIQRRMIESKEMAEMDEAKKNTSIYPDSLRQMKKRKPDETFIWEWSTAWGWKIMKPIAKKDAEEWSKQLDAKAGEHVGDRPDDSKTPKVQMESKKGKSDSKDDGKLDARETKELVDKSLSILANVLAVGLSQIEAQHGHHFESSQDAKKFLLQALTTMRTSGQTEIINAVRRFDRIGGERLVQQYRRELGELL